jgi:hypothetical protein
MNTGRNIGVSDRAIRQSLEKGTPFGKHLLYDVWKKACGNLGIEGIDLYGGTRHTTLQFLRQQMSTEDVKRLSQHTTNKALDRYIEIQHQELRDGYALTPGDRLDRRKPRWLSSNRASVRDDPPVSFPYIIELVVIFRAVELLVGLKKD